MTVVDPVAAFRARLRQLFEQVHRPPYRRLQAHADLAGLALPTSTIGDLLTGSSTPRWETVAAFIRACASYARSQQRPVPISVFDLDRWYRDYRCMEGALGDRNADNERTAGRKSRARRGRDTVVPAQLPADVPAFTGRTRYLAELDALLDAGASTMVISAIAGTAGVGKTALAVHWAHKVRNRFPEGQLYVNLRGFHPDKAVMEPDEAIRGFLDALDIPPNRVPVGLEAQSALYRSLLADRRMLVVLDNARDTGQVRPLLPGSPGCLVVITSRNRLTGLIASDAANPITLDLLSPDEAAEMLARRIGHDRTAAEPEAVQEIISRCARLPLALAVVAARAGTQSHLLLATLAADMRDGRDRLDTLTSDDAAMDVRTVFSWSYDALTSKAARLFRLLGLHPGSDISTPAAASLAGLTVPRVRTLLAELTQNHLVVEHVSGRYTLHDLLRAYATGLAAHYDSVAARQAASARLFDYYLAAAAAAMDVLYPAEAHRRPQIPPAATPIPTFTDADTAHTWLDRERSTLAAVITYAADLGWLTHAMRLSTILSRYLDGGHYTEALRVHADARRAAQRAGDWAGEADALRNLGVVYYRLGSYQQAIDHHEVALALFRQAGDPAGQARALDNLGIAEERLGRYRPATEHLRQALALYEDAGDRLGKANALNNLGNVERGLGCYAQSAEYHEQALRLFREVGHLDGEARVLNGLGMTEVQMGAYQSAAEHHEQALIGYRRTGNETGQASALDNLGTVYTRLGRSDQAAEHHLRALSLFRRTGDRDGEAWALNGLGEASLAAGHPGEALTHHTAALAVATEIGSRDQQARAHAGLSGAYDGLGQPVRACEHHERAVALYADLQKPDVA